MASGNDNGGVKAMDVDALPPLLEADASSGKRSQLPWVEKYRPSRCVYNMNYNFSQILIFCLMEFPPSLQIGRLGRA